MRGRYKTLAWGSCLALTIVTMALAQAPRQGRNVRRQVRNEDAVPLRKARPEAADPLAKIAGRSGKTNRKWFSL